MNKLKLILLSAFAATTTNIFAQYTPYTPIKDKFDNKEVKDNGGKVCSYYLEKGDYFKLDNVTLGYTFTPKNRHLLESLRVYLTAKNLFTITGYKGHDPSIVPQNGITPGVDETGAYPQATQVSLGVTLRFH